jgi:CRP-like cAMP-binding protein
LHFGFFLRATNNFFFFFFFFHCSNITAIGFLSESELPPYETHTQLLAEGFRDFFYEFVKTGKAPLDRDRSIRTFSHFRASSELSRSASSLSSSLVTPVSALAAPAAAEVSLSSSLVSSELADDELDEEEEEDEADDDDDERAADGEGAAHDSDDDGAVLSSSQKKKKKKKHKKHRKAHATDAEPAALTSAPTSRMTQSERRGKVLAEIVATERSYIASLKKVMQIYVEPIRAAHGTATAILTADDEVKIFSTIDRLIPINTTLADGLEERGAVSNADAVVGDAFLKFTDTLDAYLQYVNMFDLSQERCQANLKQNKAFRAFCDACAANELSAGLPLNAYLIMPIQRSPRYVLLLGELVKSTPDTHADYEPLTKALRLIRSFTDMLNRRKRELEDAKQLESMMAKFDRVRFRFIVDGRRFVQRVSGKTLAVPGQVESDDMYTASLAASTAAAVDDISNDDAVLGSSDCVLWLFSDVLVCTAPKSIASRKYEVLWHVDLALADAEMAPPTPGPGGGELHNLRLAEERQLPQPPFSRVVRRKVQYAADGDDGALFGGLVKGCIDEAKRNLKPPATERAAHLLHTLVQPADWQLLFAGGVTRVFEKGDVIVKYDEDSEESATPWRVVSGSVTASRRVPGIDAPVVIQTFVAGDVFGEDSFLSGGAMFEYAAASRSTNVVRANADVLISMLEARPVVAERFYQRCAIAMSYRVVTALVQNKVERALRFDVCGDLAAAADVEERKKEANAAELERLRQVIDRAVHEHAPLGTPKKQRELASKKERERLEATKLREKFDLPPDELLVTRAVCQLSHKKVTRAKSELFVFQSCIVMPYRHFGLAHRVNVVHSDIMTLETEGGNQIVLESRDPKVSRHSRLYLKYVIVFESTLLRDELFKSMNSLWLAATATATATSEATSSRAISASSSVTSSPSGSRADVHGRPVSMGLADSVARYAPLAPRDTSLLLTEVDWQVLFGDANELVVEAGDVVLQQGHCFRRLYHVQEGELDVMIDKPVSSSSGRLSIAEPSTSAIGHLPTGSMFGDITFLIGGGASATLRARVKSRVSSVERRALTPLFDRNALLAGKFYKYVALSVRKRVAVIERRLVEAAVGLARRARSETTLAPTDGLPTVSTLARSGQLSFVLGEVARSSRRVSNLSNDVHSAGDNESDDDDGDDTDGDEEEDLIL